MQSNNLNNGSSGVRFCSNCYRERDAEGGEYLFNKYGYVKRWRCSVCKDRAKERDAQIKKRT